MIIKKCYGDYINLGFNISCYLTIIYKLCIILQKYKTKIKNCIKIICNELKHLYNDICCEVIIFKVDDDNNNEIKSVHEAYQKEFYRLNKEHCQYIDKLENYYKKEITHAQISSSKELVKTIQSLLDANEKYKSKMNALNNKIDDVIDTYNRIISDFEKKQRGFVSQILDLKEENSQEIKCKFMLLSENVMLKKEIKFLKLNLKKQGILLWWLYFKINEKMQQFS
ncbi:uncharacterized protein LOC126907820 isoform X2 [Daktulosphaira vitifoliae]|uniref:uncharacterized protein LOC126907820 isoform X2 n=1 Tax=Daktulosphaira vitifoliae TaxID=58002 RepID=UPI0021A9D693|nr:uncharacterized protein LOC126907820 isoform X2 [Daktulosphaira vitifoliae]